VITDASGRIIYDTKITAQFMKVAMSQLPAAMYYVKAMQPGGSDITVPFLHN
jgi:hypothetical protein